MKTKNITLAAKTKNQLREEQTMSYHIKYFPKKSVQHLNRIVDYLAPHQLSEQLVYQKYYQMKNSNIIQGNLNKKILNILRDIENTIFSNPQ